MLEQVEGDARAERAAGADDTVQSFRERLDADLNEERSPDSDVPSEERELRHALGVA